MYGLKRCSSEALTSLSDVSFVTRLLESPVETQAVNKSYVGVISNFVNVLLDWGSTAVCAKAFKSAN